MDVLQAYSCPTQPANVDVFEWTELACIVRMGVSGLLGAEAYHSLVDGGNGGGHLCSSEGSGLSSVSCAETGSKEWGWWALDEQ